LLAVIFLFCLQVGFGGYEPIGFPDLGTKSKTGEWLKPALPLAFSASQKKF
jgi:hypothetical protein